MSGIGDALTRIVELQELAVPNAAAKPFGVYTSPSFPYWTNQVAIQTITRTSSNRALYTYNVTMRLYLGNLTEGYDGDLELKAVDYLESVSAFFEPRSRLQTPTYPLPLDALGQHLVAVLPGRVAQFGEPSAPQLGVLIPLEVPIPIRINRA